MERQLRVVQAAKKYRFAAVQVYDTRLRQAMSRDHSISIGNLHMELFTQSFTGQALPVCAKCKRTGHSTVACVAKPSLNAPFRASTSGPSGKPICKMFNKGNCTFSNCSYQLRCMFCKGTHQAMECPARASARKASSHACTAVISSRERYVHIC